MKWEIMYFDENVQQDIENWPVGIRAYYTRITERMIQFGPNLGMPYTRAMGKGLFEIRAKGEEGIGRAFFCTAVGKKVFVLHVLIKKTEKTPKGDIDIARKRLKEIVNHEKP